MINRYSKSHHTLFFVSMRSASASRSFPKISSDFIRLDEAKTTI